jgi:hypothetical protein
MANFIKMRKMKVYWWQAGLHFEPESESDSTALTVLSKSLKLIQIDEEIVAGPIGSTDLGNEESVVGVNKVS